MLKQITKFHKEQLLIMNYALQTLVLFEKKFIKLKEERDNIVKAKEALELSGAGLRLLYFPFCLI